MEETYQPQSYNKSFKARSAILQLSALIVVIAIIIFVLNYFKLINLSNLAKKTATTRPVAVPAEIRNTVPFMSCPVSNCLSGKVTKDASSSAYVMTFNLPTDATISAALDGNLTKVDSNTFTIEDKQRGILVKYQVKTDKLQLTTSTSVSEKQPIATLGSGPNTLIFSATATLTKTSLHLQSGPDGSYLTNQE